MVVMRVIILVTVLNPVDFVPACVPGQHVVSLRGTGQARP